MTKTDMLRMTRERNNKLIGGFINLKRLYALLIALVLMVVIIIVALSNRSSLSNKIIKFIDNNCDKNNACFIKMLEITDFEWDKMLIYQVGSSTTEISEALGVEFKDSVDLMSGMVFVKENKIVYNQSIPYNPERPSKLLLHVGGIFREDNNKVFTPNDAIFKGSRIEKEGQLFYKIEPLYSND